MNTSADYFEHVSRSVEVETTHNKKYRTGILTKILFFYIYFPVKFIQLIINIIKNRDKFNFNIISKIFGFEDGITDIFDEASVLYRRNIVIQRVIFMANIMFMILILYGSTFNNIIITVVLFLITFPFSRFLNNLIKVKPITLNKQQLAMYLSSSYILIVSIGVYIKLKFDAFTQLNQLINTNVTSLEDILSITSIDSITQLGYILLFFTLVVTALYQNKELQKWMSIIVVISSLIINLTLLYPVYNMVYSWEDFLFIFTKTTFFKDIILRLLILIIFSITMFGVVIISDRLKSSRLEDLSKRKDLEKDLKMSLSNIHDVVLMFDKTSLYDGLEKQYKIAKMSYELSKVIGVSLEETDQIYDYALCHVDDSDPIDYELLLQSDDFELLKNKTKQGNRIVKRLQLSKKAEDIVISHINNVETYEFKHRMNEVQNYLVSEVILICEIYTILRSKRDYKQEYKHSTAVSIIQNKLKDYISFNVIDKFIKYHSVFNDIYNNIHN